MTERRSPLLGLELAAGALSATVALAMIAVSLDVLRFHRSALAFGDVPSTGVILIAVLLVSAASAVLFVATLIREGVRGGAFRQRLGGRPTTLFDVPLLVVVDQHPRAFCAGLLRPRVYVTDGLLQRFPAAELRSVIAHESHHARRFDPLRFAVGRALANALWFVPAIRQSRRIQESVAELAADSAAVRIVGARPLAAALLRFDECGAGGSGLAGLRVYHLLGCGPGGIGRPWSTLVSASIFAALAVSLAWLASAATLADCLPFSASPTTLLVLGGLALSCVPATLAGKAAGRALSAPSRQL